MSPIIGMVGAGAGAGATTGAGAGVGAGAGAGVGTDVPMAGVLPKLASALSALVFCGIPATLLPRL